MRAELVIANRGFALQVNEYDICMNERRYFAAQLFWGSPVPRYSVKFSAEVGMNYGGLTFGQSINGKRSTYILQGPIQKLNG
jgi:hypothetical protein